MARAEGAREKVLGALPRNPARGTPPETPGRCGNAGRWTPVENSPLALRADHSSTSKFPTVAQPPLEIAKGAIPTFPQRRRVSHYCKGKQKRPRKLGNVQKLQKGGPGSSVAPLPPPGSFFNEKMLPCDDFSYFTAIVAEFELCPSIVTTSG